MFGPCSCIVHLCSISSICHCNQSFSQCWEGAMLFHSLKTNCQGPWKIYFPGVAVSLALMSTALKVGQMTSCVWLMATFQMQGNSFRMCRKLLFRRLGFQWPWDRVLWYSFQGNIEEKRSPITCPYCSEVCLGAKLRDLAGVETCQVFGLDCNTLPVVLLGVWWGPHFEIGFWINV